MMTLRFDRQALADLEAIRSHISESGSNAAERVLHHLSTQIDHLKLRPLLGKATNDADIRVLFPTKYPYSIYYLVSSDEVVILHVRHTSRKPPGLGDLLR